MTDPESFIALGTGDVMMYSKEMEYYAGLRDSVLKQMRSKTIPPAFFVQNLRETVEAEAGFWPDSGDTAGCSLRPRVYGLRV